MTVFTEIRRAQPARLFIASDGPRQGVESERELIEQTRESILAAIDWNCDIQTLFRTENLGCRQAVTEAITWFFSSVDSGIILEDDCLPHPTFFGFCRELLDRYRDDSRVMMISGDNFQGGRWRGDSSYYFSRYAHIWGWATWRRAWQRMDADLGTLGAFEEQGQWKNLFDENESTFWRNVLSMVQGGEIDTWDYVWLYSVLSNGGLCAMPNVNLVTNIGFGDSATHTKGMSPLANIPRAGLGEIKHPRFVLPNRAADAHTFAGQWSGNPQKGFVARLLERLR